MLLSLFLTFFKIGLFSFGGGYAMLALIQSEVVTKHKWLSIGEFTDIIAISQVTPGPISINAATYIGWKTTNSWIGSALATFGVALPSFIVIVLMFLFLAKYNNSNFVKNTFKALRPTAAGLVFSAALLLMTKENFIDTWSIALFLGSFILLQKKWAGAITLIFVSGLIGILLYGP